jgi:hypothetical protein
MRYYNKIKLFSFILFLIIKFLIINLRLCMERIYLHSDMNNYFVSVKSLYNSSLKNILIVFLILDFSVN